MTDVEWQAMGREVRASIESAVAFAEASPFPKPEQALEDMYAA
jgi:TPP-dependent pyruvate/acetoin dehydrogenase alpha subunit